MTRHSQEGDHKQPQAKRERQPVFVEHRVAEGLRRDWQGGGCGLTHCLVSKLTTAFE
jgi:hypothetical protein